VNTSEIGLETVGLEPGKPVEVGSNLRSPRHDWLYAIGDANGRALLTHMGKYQGRLAADAILGKSVTVLSDGPLSPRVIFTDPQVAAVGHTLGSAEAAGMVVRAVDVATSGTAGASFVGRNTPGTSRLVIDDVKVPRSSVSRSARCFTPRRSPSSARSRSTGSATPSRPSRRGVSSG
jgi:dihydrolipoamide dehydrogenase